MGKAILVLLDGCGYDVATKYAGVLEQLVEKGRCAKYRLRGELPSMSRPMYETVMTGLDATTHGIITNDFTNPAITTTCFPCACARERPLLRRPMAG